MAVKCIGDIITDIPIYTFIDGKFQWKPLTWKLCDDCNKKWSPTYYTECPTCFLKGDQ